MLERDDENLAKKRANKEKIREHQQAINTLHDDNESIDEDRIKQRIIYVLCGFFKEKQQQLNQKDFEKAAVTDTSEHLAGVTTELEQLEAAVAAVATEISEAKAARAAHRAALG